MSVRHFSQELFVGVIIGRGVPRKVREFLVVRTSAPPLSVFICYTLLAPPLSYTFNKRLFSAQLISLHAVVL